MTAEGSSVRHWADVRRVSVLLAAMVAVLMQGRVAHGQPQAFTDRGAFLAAAHGARIPDLGQQNFGGFSEQWYDYVTSGGALGTVSIMGRIGGGVAVARVTDRGVTGPALVNGVANDPPQIMISGDLMAALPFAIGFDIGITQADGSTPDGYQVAFRTARGDYYYAQGGTGGFFGLVATDIADVPTIFYVDPEFRGSGCVGFVVIDNIVYRGGPGTSPGNPIYPDSANCSASDCTFMFQHVIGNQALFLDPVVANRYTYSTLDGSSFTYVGDFPVGFSAPFHISSRDVDFGSFGPGAGLAFPPPGVQEFTISGISPAVDGQNPTAFPVRVKLNSPDATLQVTAWSAGSGDTTPPAIRCGGASSMWQAGDAVIPCWATDDGSGLADPRLASFSLSTRVPAGTETVDAWTDRIPVCDVAGNCATAGPITRNMIDKRAPTITLSAPAGGNLLLNQSVVASYSCTDGGSGVATCSGSSASGARIDTSTVGSKTFAVDAADRVGNRATASASYTISYGVSALYDQLVAKRAGSTFPIKIQLVDVAGANVSTVDIAVTAVGVGLKSSSILGPVDDSGSANPEGNFRYDSSLGGYIFNLSTKGMTTGTYVLSFRAGADSAIHTVEFAVK